MIQRKQTLFLALAAVLCFLSWLLPVATYSLADGTYTFHTRGLMGPDATMLEEVATKVPLHLLMTVLGAALSISIFLYGNRPRQMRVVRTTYLIALATVAVVFITDNSITAYLGARGPMVHGYGASYFIPLVVLVLSFAAERSIRADERLVRSMDRLR